ncbi:ANTAR domain-containing protein [Ilumatobacter sp.]|uniref:ANTAR domain-containing protein n=1 Tax=Ilumatobacter sp. TaxID=1967498 RepID=UPI003B52F29D
MASEAITDKLIELSQVLVADDGLDATLGRVARLSTSLIDACDSCGVSLIRDGSVSTRAASDERADRIDDIQYSHGEGPCLQAIETGETVHVTSFAQEERWPQFIESALDEGIRASYSVPLRVEQNVVGSLNFYSIDGAFTDSDKQIGDVLASQAAVALHNARTFNEVLNLVDQLNEALASRDLIGQSKGILMANLSLGPDQAFDVLRRESQNRNVKLRDLAEQVVSGAVVIDGASVDSAP